MRGIGKSRLRLLNTIKPFASMILSEDYREQYLHEFCDRSNQIIEYRCNGYGAGATFYVDRPSLWLDAY